MRPDQRELTHVLRSLGYLLIDDVLAVIKMSKTKWYGGIRKGTHPRPFKFGNKSLWKDTQIAKFVVR